MAKTRAAHRRSASARKSYRRRVRSSPCRGKGPAACRGTSGCKVASGRRRSFCRKGSNTRRRRGGTRGRKGHGRGRHAGTGVLAKAAVPFGLFGLQKHFQ